MASVEIVKLALPLLSRFAVPSIVAPSLNVAVPVGGPFGAGPPCGVAPGCTFAVSVSDWP